MRIILSCCLLALVISACAPSPPDSALQERAVEITLAPIEDTPTDPPTDIPTDTPFVTWTPRPTRTHIPPTIALPTATFKPIATSQPAATAVPTKKTEKKAQPTQGGTVSKGNCSPAYPNVCIPPPPPDLDCKDIKFRRFKVVRPDPHNFDSDGDGIGCES